MVRIISAIVFLLVGHVVWGQEIETASNTTSEPKSAFFENAPLAEAGFTEARYNTKQQRLGEHYLATPVGELPADRDVREAEIQPPPTEVRAVGEEAGVGVAIRQNRALNDSEINDAASTVCEPSLAVRGEEILLTGNWFASFSRDGGASFAYRNPETMFPAIPGRPFCCDQVAHYIPSHDLMVWFLQHVKDATGNTVRLAVAQGPDIAAERWRFYDFTPQQVGSWQQQWFDYPDIAFSDQFLFVTTNCFNMSNQFTRSVVLRLPLGELSTYAAVNYRYFDRTDVGSLRPTQGGGNVMYIGCHQNTGTLQVFAWPDAALNVQNKTFNVQPWIRGGALAPGPDGNDWLGFVDGRMTAAWSVGASQGFAWTSAQGGAYARPHVRVAIVDWNAGSVSSQPHIWNSQFAFAYPAATVNQSGHVGISVSYGGGSILFPSHAVGVRNGNAWSMVATVNGTNGPDRNRWGDYLTARTNGHQPTRFACTGFSLAAGTTRRDVVPRLVQFDVVPLPESQPESAAQPQPQPGMPTPALAAGVDAETAKQETGLKFSLDTFRKNEASRISYSNLARFAVGDAGEPTERRAVIPIDPAADWPKYQALLGLRDIGEYFFDQPETVCWPDDRVQVLDTASAPWNGNCQLIITFADGSQARGTGWFLSPRLIVTAGHCVHEGAGGSFFQSVEVIPGMNGPMMPFGSQMCPSTHLRASENWIQSGIVADDYGAILLPGPFTGPGDASPALLPAVVRTDSEFSGILLGISGYPADKATGTQWRDQGPIDAVTATRLNYKIDTFGGHSGSAVFTAAGDRRAVGIHNYGGCPNKCSRITAEVLADLERWRAESEQ